MQGWEGEWIHVDLAGPSTDDERGTGYGVGLALGLLDKHAHLIPMVLRDLETLTTRPQTCHGPRP